MGTGRPAQKGGGAELDPASRTDVRRLVSLHLLPWSEPRIACCQWRGARHEPQVAILARVSTFRLLTQLNDPENSRCLGYRGYVDPLSARCFGGDALHDRFARALAARRAVAFKEVLESFEFFARVRKHLRASVIADLCAGHGLVGALFAIYEKRVEEVHFLERTPPASRVKVLEAAREVAPWTATKFREQRLNLRRQRPELPAGTAIVAVHACGTLSDVAIELGLELGGPIALLPCCRPHRQSPAPGAIARAVGDDLAFDIDRTYRMERAGYHVRWDEIPEVITPMNRILVGKPKRTSECVQSAPGGVQGVAIETLGGESA